MQCYDASIWNSFSLSLLDSYFGEFPFLGIGSLNATWDLVPVACKSHLGYFLAFHASSGKQPSGHALQLVQVHAIPGATYTEPDL